LNRYDTTGKGFVNHQDFLKQLTVGEQFAPGDQHGTSHKIASGSYMALEKHHRDQQLKHAEMVANQSQQTVYLTAEQIISQLR